MASALAVRTTYAVWELTLRCNLGCVHCGSRAGDARAAELTTAEALDLVAQLKAVGIDEVTLIGGEAYLRPDWLTIVAAIREAGMACTLTSGGYGISAELARRMKAADLQQVSISLDGLSQTHDRLRGRIGAHRFALQALQHLRDAGLPVTCNTQINRLSAPELPLLYEQLRDAGAHAWQVQLTVPMGNAADRPELLLQPSELLVLYPVLAELSRRAERDGVYLLAGNNIGYYGPYERLLRGHGHPYGFFRGCQAGLRALGIEADGTIKGCPSLPTADYAGGDIRRRPLRQIVEEAPQLRFNLDADRAALWGFCQGCEHAALCRGGCTWTAHVFFGRRGNNPYCHHRALTLAAQGLRERLVQLRPAPGQPFDHGAFAATVEPLDAPWPEEDLARRLTADRIRWPAPGR